MAQRKNIRIKNPPILAIEYVDPILLVRKIAHTDGKNFLPFQKTLAGKNEKKVNQIYISYVDFIDPDNANHILYYNVGSFDTKTYTGTSDFLEQIIYNYKDFYAKFTKDNSYEKYGIIPASLNFHYPSLSAISNSIGAPV